MRRMFANCHTALIILYNAVYVYGGEIMSFKCKTCGSKLRVRTSSEMSPTVRSAYYECTNEECVEEYAGSHVLGNVVRPSKKLFKQLSIDFFMAAVPEHKRAAVLHVLNS